MNIILASASPRRLDILRDHGIEPVVIPTDTDETLPDGIGMTDAVTLLARRKAEACYSIVSSDPSYRDHIIIAADTIVWKDSIMGKPESAEDARRMLEAIRGTYHYVVTGVALLDTDSGSVSVLTDTTKVYCTSYSDEDISSYI